MINLLIKSISILLINTYTSKMIILDLKCIEHLVVMFKHDYQVLQENSRVKAQANCELMTLTGILEPLISSLALRITIAIEDDFRLSSYI